MSTTTTTTTTTNYLDNLSIRQSAEYSDDPAKQEIEILKTIFSEDVFNQVDDTTYQVRISVNIKDDFNLIVKDLKDQTIKYPIISLPPITLGFSYPEEYPELTPPELFIASSWLSIQDMTKALDYLYSIWESGELVMFRYTDWIRGEMLEYLGIDDSYILSSDRIDEDQVEDGSVVWEKQAKDWISLVSSLPLILGHNEQESRSIFTQNYHTCPVCFDDLPGQEFHLFSCHHYLCHTCTRSIVTINSSTKEYTLIKCSARGCNRHIDPGVVRDYLGSPTLMQEYNNMLKMESGYRTCPKCSTISGRFDSVSNSISCQSCNFRSCSFCSMSWHPGVPCRKPKKLIQVDDNTTVEAPDDMENDETMQLYLMDLKGFRMCPNCGVFVEKLMGCNKMTCNMCGSYFCWQCLVVIKGYDHFADCTTRYSGLVTMVGNWRKKRAEAERQKKDRELQMLPCKLEQRCVRCKSRVNRNNLNNHLKCARCKTEFCFICRETIQGTKHFSDSTCPQHGGDSSVKAEEEGNKKKNK